MGNITYMQLVEYSKIIQKEIRELKGFSKEELRKLRTSKLKRIFVNEKLD